MAIYYGNDDPNTIGGSAYRDIIYGYGNNDTLRGYGGDDDIYGGSGNDLLDGGAGNDYLDGGSGNDKLIGGSGINTLVGGYGADQFIMSTRGTGFSDDLVADFYPTTDGDKLNVANWGVSDFSQIQALLYNDEYGNATINAFYNGYAHYLSIDGFRAGDLRSSDFIYSNSGAKTQNGTAYADVLFGSRFDDTLNGLAGDDILLGGQGNDTLAGGSGYDDLIGGLGRDVLSGGANADAFIFNDIAESAPGAASRDLIQDFQQGLDLIDLERIDWSTASGDQDFAWRGTAAFTGAGQLRYYQSGGNTIVEGSTDGDADPEFQIELAGLYTLTRYDFDL